MKYVFLNIIMSNMADSDQHRQFLMLTVYLAVKLGCQLSQCNTSPLERWRKSIHPPVDSSCLSHVLPPSSPLISCQLSTVCICKKKEAKIHNKKNNNPNKQHLWKHFWYLSVISIMEYIHFIKCNNSHRLWDTHHYMKPCTIIHSESVVFFLSDMLCLIYKQTCSH